jgi:hypothetical protein
MQSPPFEAFGNAKKNVQPFDRFKPVLYVGEVYFKKSLKPLDLAEKSALCEAAIAACVDFGDRKVTKPSDPWQPLLDKHTHMLSAQAKGSFASRAANLIDQRVTMTVSRVAELGVSLRRLTARCSFLISMFAFEDAIGSHAPSLG